MHIIESQKSPISPAVDAFGSNYSTNFPTSLLPTSNSQSIFKFGSGSSSAFTGPAASREAAAPGIAHNADANANDGAGMASGAVGMHASTSSMSVASNASTTSYLTHGMSGRRNSIGRTAGSSSSTGTGTATRGILKNANRRKSSEVDMLDGVVDMDAFNQILALDEDDATKEFSKALVWAWCDQADLATGEIDLFLKQGNIVAACSKAHYLKGSSSSLGLIKVSQTCQSLYHIHFPPSLAHFRNYSYQLNYSDSASSSGYSSASTSSGFGNGYSFGANSNSSGHGSASSRSTATTPSPGLTSGSGPCSGSSVAGGLTRSPAESPKTEKEINFEEDKYTRAYVLLGKLKNDIREASEWLYRYYTESDRFNNISAPL